MGCVAVAPYRGEHGPPCETGSYPCRSVELDARVAQEYGRLRAHLRAIGRPIGPNDLWIAAHALARSVPLITHNLSEFGRVPGLSVDTWMTA